MSWFPSKYLSVQSHQCSGNTRKKWEIWSKLTKTLERRHRRRFLSFCVKFENYGIASQQIFTCSKLSMETLEKGGKYVQN